MHGLSSITTIEATRAESERIRQEYRTGEAYKNTLQGQLETALASLTASQAKFDASETKWQAELDASKAEQQDLIRRMDKYEKYRLSNLLSLALVRLKNFYHSLKH
jgi:DNA anti-recombination protein RmuC